MIQFVSQFKRLVIFLLPKDLSLSFFVFFFGFQSFQVKRVASVQKLIFIFDFKFSIEKIIRPELESELN